MYIPCIVVTRRSYNVNIIRNSRKLHLRKKSEEVGPVLGGLLVIPIYSKVNVHFIFILMKYLIDILAELKNRTEQKSCYIFFSNVLFCCSNDGMSVTRIFIRHWLDCLYTFTGANWVYKDTFYLFFYTRVYLVWRDNYHTSICSVFCHFITFIYG